MADCYVDGNRYSFVRVQSGKKYDWYISLIDGYPKLLKKRKSFRRDLHPLTLNGEPYPAERAAQIYYRSPLFPLSTVRARAAILRLLGKRIITVDFYQEKVRIDSKPKGRDPNLVTVNMICEELGIAPFDAREWLRLFYSKPGGRWQWPPEEAEQVKQDLAKAFSKEQK